MHQVIRLVAGLAGAAAFAAVVPVATVATAQASPTQPMGLSACLQEVHDRGYDVGPKVTAACHIAADNPLSAPHQAACTLALVDIGVDNDTAGGACIAASWPGVSKP
ncbi:putative secreted protein [Kutzneria albida DSM 43870]|uniref:Putative secreted protein n=1 Tax=Kutzneria albida DSM 43870 TaxID=1449976 RepID=W5W6K9_9PSEU|nr:putative secreted protein [Kutzneria albida DSM 43870]